MKIVVEDVWNLLESVQQIIREKKEELSAFSCILSLLVIHNLSCTIDYKNNNGMLL